MSKLHWIAAAAMLAAGIIVAYSTGLRAGEEKEVKTPRLYELRTYTTLPGRLDALNARFRDHTMKLFKKHGMTNEMYWIPTDPKLKDNTLIYIVSHESQEAADKSWAAFRADPEWIKARDASEKDGKIVEKVVSLFMTRTDYSPGGK